MSVVWKGLNRYRRKMKRAGDRKIKQRLKLKLREAGKLLRVDQKKRVSKRFTNPTTRKRTDKGPELGRVSGRGRRSISFSSRVRSKTEFFVEIGPKNQGGGFYMAFHALGQGGFRKRDFVTPSVKANEEKVFKLLGKTFEVV